MGVLSETFETAITWDRLDAFVERVTRRRARPRCASAAAPGQVTVPPHARLSRRRRALLHRASAPARRGDEVAQWAVVKRAAAEAIIADGGTITHHHAVGRDHRPWYDRQRPDPFAAALRGAKAAVDPAGILNPGVLWGP